MEKKNIWLVKTNKPSKLQIKFDGGLHMDNGQTIAMRSFMHIHITSEDLPSDGDWCIDTITQEVFIKSGGYSKGETSLSHPKKIIMSMDEDIIKNGYLAIPENFISWFIDNSSCRYIRPRDIKLISELIDALDAKRINMIRDFMISCEFDEK